MSCSMHAETNFIKLGNNKNRVISFIHTRKRQHYRLMGLIEPWFIVDGLLSYRSKNAGIGFVDDVFESARHLFLLLLLLPLREI